MYKYADTTYPLYEAVSMETSLYEAVGLFTFRFEPEQALDTLTAFDYFSFTALYRFKDRVRFSDYYRFSVSSRRCDTTVSGDRFRIKNPHSESFLLGATGPANTALGGRIYV